MLSNIAVFSSIFLVFGFALFQFSLTLGSPLGEYSLGGLHKVLPIKMRFVSGFFTGLFVVVGLSYLQKTSLIAPVLNNDFVNILLITYTLFLTYAVIANGFITKSKKEKYVMTPLSVIALVSSIYVLLKYTQIN